MKSKFWAILAVGMLMGPMAANAVVVTYDFTWTGTAGPNAGTSESGFMSFDDSYVADPSDFYRGTLLDFGFSWDGFNYDENDVLAGLRSIAGSADALAVVLIGTDCTLTVDGGFECAAPIAGSFSFWFQPFASFIYLTSSGFDTGTVAWSLRTVEVPEPGTLALLGLGFATLGLSMLLRLRPS